MQDKTKNFLEFDAWTCLIARTLLWLDQVYLVISLKQLRQNMVTTLLIFVPVILDRMAAHWYNRPTLNTECNRD